MAKKSAAKKTKKKPASKKTAPKKKSRAPASGTAKKSSPSKKSVTKKKSTKKKVLTKKKTSSKKKVTGKKKTAKKTTSKSKVATKGATSKKTVKKAGASASGGDKKGATNTKKKKTKSKSTAVKIGRGRSVAEVASTATADDQGYVVINGRRVRMISTKGVTPAKKTRSTTATAEVDTTAKIPEKPIKTKLKKRQLDHYKKLLLIKRGEIVGDLSAMEAEALRSSDGDLSNMPIHMADLGSDTYEQDFMLGMAQSERERLREIDEALQRIVDRTYGICKMTGEPIPKTRLEAKPWAKYTIEAARQLEGSWVPR